MTYVRKSVWANGGDFADPILYWYAKGVGALKTLPLSNPTSWRFIAAIHGIDLSLWQQYGYYTPGETMPPQAVQDLYWNQCQHQTWYFLPWHRGYIWSIESLVRMAVVSAGGPDDWAMPYWNYSDAKDPNARMLPPAFARTTLPDGSPNPLYVQQRYGQGKTPIVLPARDVTLQALNVPNFTGTGGGALSGFGGIKTGFSHSGTVQGQLESRPHNIVHVDVGGSDAAGPGLMSDPDTAGLDPIFWLHHSNIDRLWVDWIDMGAPHGDPDDPAWLSGPLDRKFVVPDVEGKAYFYTPAAMIDTTAAPLNYTYGLGAPVAAVAAAPVAAAVTRAAMAPDKAAALIGASSASLAVIGTQAKADVQMDTAPSQAVAASLRAATQQAPLAASAHTAPVHDRVLLNLENIRAARDGAVIDVYVGLPEGANPDDRPDLLAGTIALFGARKASLADRPHGGAGISEVLDITSVVTALAREGRLAGPQLSVHLVPRQEATAEAKISVGRISIYRQEA